MFVRDLEGNLINFYNKEVLYKEQPDDTWQIWAVMMAQYAYRLNASDLTTKPLAGGGFTAVMWEGTKPQCDEYMNFLRTRLGALWPHKLAQKQKGK